MRSSADDAPVRLYHLDPESGAATTLAYAPLAEALALAAAQPTPVQAALWLQTRDDVAAYLDLAD